MRSPQLVVAALALMICPVSSGSADVVTRLDAAPACGLANAELCGSWIESGHGSMLTVRDSVWTMGDLYPSERDQCTALLEHREPGRIYSVFACTILLSSSPMIRALAIRTDRNQKGQEVMAEVSVLMDAPVSDEIACLLTGSDWIAAEPQPVADGCDLITDLYTRPAD